MHAATGPELSRKIQATVDSGTWAHARAVLVDGGRFPRRRLREVAALLPRFVVLDNRGAAEELSAHGAQDVVLDSGRSIADAIRAASEYGALVIFTPEPLHAAKELGEAVETLTSTAGSSLPVAAVMVMRDRTPAAGPLVPVAERTPVSGFGALFAAALAAKTDRGITVSAPPAQGLPVSDATAFAAAKQLASQFNTPIEIREDPAPLEWALRHSSEHAAHFFGVLEAHQGSRLTGSHVVARGHDELSSAITAVERSSCDVVVVLDTISLIHGRAAGARVAHAVGAILVSSIALGSIAGPAAAAESATYDQVAVEQDSGTVVDITDATVAARAQQRAVDQAAAETAAQDPRERASQQAAAQAGQEQAAQQRATAQELAESESLAEPTGEATADHASSGGGSAEFHPEAGETDSVDPEGGEEPLDRTGPGDFSGEDANPEFRVEESETEYIGITVWTDSHGKQHMISTGIQHHEVEAPDLPDWAKKDGGDHPQLAAKSTAQSGGRSGAATSSSTDGTATAKSAKSGGETHPGHQATTGKKAHKSKHKASKHKKHGHKADKHKASKHKKHGHKAGKHKNRGTGNG